MAEYVVERTLSDTVEAPNVRTGIQEAAMLGVLAQVEQLRPI